MLSATLPSTTTRDKRISNITTMPSIQCTSEEFSHEHFKIAAMIRTLNSRKPRDTNTMWMINMLSEALVILKSLDNPSSSPLDSRKADNARWTDVLVRRTMAEHLWEAVVTHGRAGENSVTFYDCYDALREGRSRALQARLCEQIRQSWERITGTDVQSEFRLR